MILKTILINEIRYLIGHNPSADELKSAIDFLEDQLYNEEKATLAMVELLLREWRDNELVECAGCGDYFLPDDIEKRLIPGSFGKEEWICSEKCFETCYEYWNED